MDIVLIPTNSDWGNQGLIRTFSDFPWSLQLVGDGENFNKHYQGAMRLIHGWPMSQSGLWLSLPLQKNPRS
jgi:hypothetical protein